MSTSTLIRIHPNTRNKLNAIRQHSPLSTIQLIIDDAIEALAKARGLDLSMKIKPRKTAA